MATESFDRQKQLRELHAARRQSTDVRAEAAIKDLLQNHQPVTFKAVSEATGISTSTLYKHERIAERIKSLRQSQQELPRTRDLKCATPDASKDAIIASLRRTIARQQEEIERLRNIANQSLSDQWRDL